MSLISDDYKTSQLPKATDGEKGSARKQNAIGIRGPWPYNAPKAAVSVATQGVGTNWSRLPNVPAVRLFGQNLTGQSLTLRDFTLGAGSPHIVVADGGTVDLPCVANAQEWQVQRTDVANGVVTLLVFALTSV